MKHRRAAKIDENQPQIVKDLRKMGFSVEPGHDDILVGAHGMTLWFEIKEPGTVSPRTGKVRPSEIKDSQKALLADWRGHYEMAWTTEQIIESVKKAVNKSEIKQLRGDDIECNYKRDILASIYEAMNKLPCCGIQAILCGAAQEIDALRDKKEGCK